MSPLPKASVTARTCSLASVKLVTDQRNERRYAAYYDTALPPFLSPLQIAPLAAPFPPSPPTSGATPSKEVLTVGRGAPKGGIRLPAPRRRSLGAALRVQLREKGPEAHAAYATEQALSPSRTREKVHALCLRPPENIRPPCAIAPRSGGRRCAFCMLSVSRANVAAKRRKGEEPPFPPSKYARERPARHCGRTVLRACQTIPRLPAEKYPGDRTPTPKVIPQAIGVQQFHGRKSRTEISGQSGRSDG